LNGEKEDFLNSRFLVKTIASFRHQNLGGLRDLGASKWIKNRRTTLRGRDFQGQSQKTGHSILITAHRKETK